MKSQTSSPLSAARSLPQSMAPRSVPTGASCAPLASAVRFSACLTRQCQCDKGGRAEPDQEDAEIGESAKKEFKKRHEPVLTVNPTNREKDLNDRRSDEKEEGNRFQRWKPVGAAKSDEGDHKADAVGEAVNVQGVNEVIDIENTPEKIENFQEKREDRNARQHHVRQIFHQGMQEEFSLVAVPPDFFFYALL